MSIDTSTKCTTILQMAHYPYISKRYIDLNRPSPTSNQNAEGPDILG